MKRIGFQMKVKKHLIEKYEEYHRNVWPEMLDALKRNGWENYSLFMREDGLIFGYVEVPDTFRKALDGMADESVNEKWQDLMSPYFEIAEGDHADKNMLELKQVFHTD